MRCKFMVLCLFSIILFVVGIEEEKTTVQPRPYLFNYKAGRFPGHVDRVHEEVGDGIGNVRGSFSYVDPRNQVRTVNYVANEYGFYPELSHPAPADTEAVSKAKERHYALYTRIAQDHAAQSVPLNTVVYHPIDTVAVTKAKEKHFNLYERIAADHARIAAEREAEKLAREAENHNELQKDY